MHYFLENQPAEVQAAAKEYKLKGPVFVGQGCTRSCGSDSYGYFVAEILEPNKLVAIVSSDAKFVKSWTDGSMVSEFPSEAIIKAEISGNKKYLLEYIMRYGKKWYRCEVEPDGKIVRIPGAKCRLSFNGAHDYRDPSF